MKRENKTGPRGGAPEGSAARALALDLLGGVVIGQQMLSDLEATPAFMEHPPATRARAARLARTTLRRRAQADAALKPFMRRRAEGEIRLLLQLGVVELLQEEAAAHGVVNACVSLARKLQPSAAGMVNAVLRKVAEAPRDPWDRSEAARLPNWLRGRLGSAYGNARVARMEAAFAEAPPVDLTPKRAEEAKVLAAQTGGTLLPTGSIRLHDAGRISALPGYESGAWWVQDAAAALPAKLLDVKPGLRVLDLCAAPGGKTLQLAASGAQVTALDISEARLERLRENLDRTGLRADIQVADALSWAPDADHGYDAILLDAPCTATGTIRRHPDLPLVRDGSRIKELVNLQTALLARAAGWLRPGGRLIYCTCSLLPDEGRAVVEAALSGQSLIEDDPTALSGLGWIEDTWRNGAAALRTTPDMWADKGGIDGFYMAALRRVPNAQS